MHRPEGQTLVDLSEIAGVLGVKPSVARHGLDRLEEGFVTPPEREVAEPSRERGGDRRGLDFADGIFG